MLGEVSSASKRVFIWLDEKIFTVEAVSNSKNETIYVHHASELADDSRTVIRRQHPARSDGMGCGRV